MTQEKGRLGKWPRVSPDKQIRDDAPIGTKVKVYKDDGSVFETVTRSEVEQPIL